VRIGIDFDNTLIGYDAVFLAAARARGLVNGALPDGASKQQIRDCIRGLADGERRWQQLQGFVYGAGIGSAVLIDGAATFLQRCAMAGHEVFIVSHKTEFGHHDPARVNLRQAALGWLRAQGLLDRARFGLSEQRIYFEATRPEKLDRIARLACTHFIDDLEEVLTDPAFPRGVARLLLGHPTDAAAASCRACPTWGAIEAAVFA
jgi:hypothetical protein